MSKYYVGDVGTIILLDTKVDLASAGVTFTSIRVKKPDSTEVEWLATVYNNTVLKYIIQDDDLDIAGRYELQAYAESASWSGLGDTVRFDVTSKFG